MINETKVTIAENLINAHSDYEKLQKHFNRILLNELEREIEKAHSPKVTAAEDLSFWKGWNSFHDTVNILIQGHPDYNDDEDGF